MDNKPNVPDIVAELAKSYRDHAGGLGCGDGACVVWARPTVMHTNGGCNCVKYAHDDKAMISRLRHLLRLGQQISKALEQQS